MSTARALLVAISAALVACGTAEEPSDASTTADAGGAGDTGSTLDGGADAPSVDDASARDASMLDAAGPDPGWTRLDGYRNDCFLEHALHPENIGRITWAPCPAGNAPSCRIAELEPASADTSFDQSPGTWDESAGHGYFTRVLTRPHLGAMRVVFDDEGTPVLALRDSGSGSVVAGCESNVALDASTVAIVASAVDSDSTTPRAPIYHAWRGTAATVLDQPLALGELASWPAMPAISLYYALTTSEITIGGANGSPTEQQVLWGAPASAPVVRALDGRFAIARDRLLSSPSPGDLHTTSADGTDEVLVSDSDAAWPAADASTIAWMHATSFDVFGGAASGDLMVSAWADHAAELAPRALRHDLTITAALSMRVGAGTVAYTDADATGAYVQLVDVLSGAATRGIVHGVTLESDRVVWITPTEVAVIVRLGDPSGPARVMRIDRSDLAAVP